MAIIFVLTIVNLSLGAVYANYETRTQLILDNTFFYLDAYWDQYGNLLRAPNISENVHVKEWLPLPIPRERKHLLIQAGITPDKALLPEIQALTQEDLNITIVLLGRTPFPWREHLGSGEEY